MFTFKVMYKNNRFIFYVIGIVSRKLQIFPVNEDIFLGTENFTKK